MIERWEEGPKEEGLEGNIVGRSLDVVFVLHAKGEVVSNPAGCSARTGEVNTVKGGDWEAPL